MAVSFGYQQVKRGTERSLLWGCVDEEGGRGEARREVSNKEGDLKKRHGGTPHHVTSRRRHWPFPPLIHP